MRVAFAPKVGIEGGIKVDSVDELMGKHLHEGAPHRDQPSKKGDRPRAIRRTKGGLNSKLHMLSDGKGRPLDFFLSPGQMADSRGVLVLGSGFITNK